MNHYPIQKSCGGHLRASGGGSRHRRNSVKQEYSCCLTPESLIRTVEDFHATSRDAIVLENGAPTFDLSTVRYSISGEYQNCLLHLWSSERKVVRRVLDAELKGEVLRLQVQRLGHTKPDKLEICQHDRRSESANRAARSAYQQELRRLLERRFPGFSIVRLSSSVDLERSFGPVYSRGLVNAGRLVSPSSA
jgi:hypothetical protein